MQQQSAAAATNTTPQHWTSTSKCGYSFPSPCVDCITAAECPEPSCPTSDELTPLCTDQCVVVACSDPEHIPSPLPRCGDLSYDNTPPCVDCDGIQNLLQCCDGLYPCYVDQPRSARVLQQPHSPRGRSQHHWDTSLTSELCSCEHMPELEAHYPSTRITSSSTFLSPPHDSSSRNTQPSLAPTASLIQPYTSAPQPFSSAVPTENHHSGNSHYRQQQDPLPLSHGEPSPAAPLICMWGNCQMQFKSLSDLVGHVNLAHLRVHSEPMGSQANHPCSISQNPDDKMPCLWGSCTAPHFLSGDVTLSGFVNHLFQDHLGVHPPQGNELYGKSQVDRMFTEMAAPQQPEDYRFQELSYGQGASNSVTVEPVLNINTVTQKNCGNNTSLHTQPQDTSSSAMSSPQTVTSTISSAMSVGETTSVDVHVCLWEGCGKSFETCNELMSHISAAHVGSGKPQYDCFWEGCTRNGGKGFSSKQKICRHLQSHTGYRPFQCPECLQSFSEAATLQQHKRRHTQEKPYKCDFPGCGKSFAITGALTIHKRVHNGQKPFKCSYCGRGFAESSNLSKHLRTHTGERPYICSELNCGKAFARPDQLTRHMNVHRRKAPATAS